MPSPAWSSPAWSRVDEARARPVERVRREAERHVKEREDIAASLTRSMNEALARLRGEPL